MESNHRRVDSQPDPAAIFSGVSCFFRIFRRDSIGSKTGAINKIVIGVPLARNAESRKKRSTEDRREDYPLCWANALPRAPRLPSPKPTASAHFTSWSHRTSPRKSSPVNADFRRRRQTKKTKKSAFALKLFPIHCIKWSSPLIIRYETRQKFSHSATRSDTRLFA
jgi:hypothetical protein